VREDAAIGRIYLPQEGLERAGIGAITPDAILREGITPALQKVLVEVAQEAEEHYRVASQAVRPGDASKLAPALLMRDVYAQLHGRMRADGWSHQKPYRLRAHEKLRVLLRFPVYAMGFGV